MDENLGRPSSYLALEPGTPVISSDGEQIGKVEQVVADEDVDVFEGLIVEHGLLSANRYVDTTQIDSIYERGVVLSIDADAAAALPEPS